MVIVEFSLGGIFPLCDSSTHLATCLLDCLDDGRSLDSSWFLLLCAVCLVTATIAMSETVRTRETLIVSPRWKPNYLFVAARTSSFTSETTYSTGLTSIHQSHICGEVIISFCSPVASCSCNFPHSRALSLDLPPFPNQLITAFNFAVTKHKIHISGDPPGFTTKYTN